MSREEPEGGWKKRLAALGLARRRPPRGAPARNAGPSARTEAGRRGEDEAARLLAASGLSILARNVRYPDGELDLVAEDAGAVVFVEVKWRKTVGHGAPAEAVTAAKRSRVVRAARRWLAESPKRFREIRFDVVALTAEPPETEWIRGAFDAA